MTQFLLDTGPIVAYLNRRDEHHRWAVDVLSDLTPPLFTCDSVLSEACFLLGRGRIDATAALALVAAGLVRSPLRVESEVARLGALMKQYRDVPMSLADACLVRMTEHEDASVVVTMDSDFEIYRRHGRKRIPTLMP